MTAPPEHPSSLALDQLVAGNLGPDEQGVARHVEACPRCERKVEQLTAQYQQFLRRLPSPEALEAAVGQRPAAASPGRWPWQRLALVGALSAATAAMVALLPLELDRAPGQPGGAPRSQDRIKGQSILQLSVRRGAASFPFKAQPLQAGDRLGLRYTSARRYLLLLSLEQSGKGTALVQDPQRQQSLAITPGKQLRLDQGVLLDDYLGQERLVALFSDTPLRVPRVLRLVSRRFKALGPAERAALRLGRLPLPADQLSWLITKQQVRP